VNDQVLSPLKQGTWGLISWTDYSGRKFVFLARTVWTLLNHGSHVTSKTTTAHMFRWEDVGFCQLAIESFQTPEFLRPKGILYFLWRHSSTITKYLSWCILNCYAAFPCPTVKRLPPNSWLYSYYLC